MLESQSLAAHDSQVSHQSEDVGAEQGDARVHKVDDLLCQSFVAATLIENRDQLLNHLLKLSLEFRSQFGLEPPGYLLNLIYNSCHLLFVISVALGQAF